MRTKLKDLMMYYGVTMGKRFTTKEKNVFFEALQKDYSQMGYHAKRDGKTNNIIIGDIDKSKMTLVTSYDTPVKMNFNAQYYPLNMRKNIKEESKNIYMLILGYIVLFLLLLFMILYLKVSFPVMAALILLITFLGYFVLKKRGNSFNFTRNSASLVLMHAIAQEREEQDISFVLLDRTANSTIGLENAKDILDTYRGTIVYLNCITSGDCFTVTTKKSVNKETEETVKKLLKTETGRKNQKMVVENEADTYLRYFKNMVQLSTGNIKDGDVVVHNTATKKDVIWDESLLKNLAETFINM